jgi:hypothetical protein
MVTFKMDQGTVNGLFDTGKYFLIVLFLTIFIYFQFSNLYNIYIVIVYNHAFQ